MALNNSSAASFAHPTRQTAISPGYSLELSPL